MVLNSLLSRRKAADEGGSTVMAIVEINIVPLGTSTPSVSQYIADAVEILKECGLKYELTSMGTIIEGDLDEILSLAKKMHEVPFFKGVKRVVTTVNSKRW